MGRNPSGSAGTGQAKMGSQVWRGRGGGSSVLRLRRRRRRVGVVQPSLGVAPSSPSSAVYVWSNTLLTEITKVVPLLGPLEAFTTWHSLVPKLGAEDKKGGGSPLSSSTLHRRPPSRLKSICR